jgi:hypothetical protein
MSRLFFALVLEHPDDRALPPRRFAAMGRVRILLLEVALVLPLAIALLAR